MLPVLVVFILPLRRQGQRRGGRGTTLGFHFTCKFAPPLSFDTNNRQTGTSKTAWAHTGPCVKVEAAGFMSAQEPQPEGGEVVPLTNEDIMLPAVETEGDEEDMEVDALGSDEEERHLIRRLRQSGLAAREARSGHDLLQQRHEAMDEETEDDEDDDGLRAGNQARAVVHGGIEGRTSAAFPPGSSSLGAMVTPSPHTNRAKNRPSEAVREVVRALRQEESVPVADLLARLRATKGELASFLFSFPVPTRTGISLKAPVRLRAMQWLLVVDYATELQQAGVQPHEPEMGGEQEGEERELGLVPADPGVLVERVGAMAPHRICQFAFKRNDIVWICKDCQKDETCVLCNDCFRLSQHQGHEVYFYQTQAGGCCDCGDEDAWDKAGFCPRHGQDGNDPLSHLPPLFIAGSRWTMAQSVLFLRQAVAALQESYDLEHVEDAVWAGEAAAPGPGEPGEYYLTLHNDDMHSKREVVEVLQQCLGLNLQTARVLTDVVQEQGEARLHFGSLEEVRPKARRLQARSLSVSLVTRRLHKIEKVAVLLVQWLYTLAGISGGTCRLVVEQLQPSALNRLMVAHGHLPKPLATALHALYLFLMADQSFKKAVAQSYADTYLTVTSYYAAGIGVAESALYTLSVQFLNRSAFVNDLVGHRHFLEVLVQALADMIQRAAGPSSSATSPPSSPTAVTALPASLSHLSSSTAHLSTPSLSSSSHNRGISGNLLVSHPIFRHRRYSPVVADLKFVLNIPGVSAHFANTCMDVWLSRLLIPLQYMHAQERETDEHVTYESREWMYAFNVQISLCHVLDCLLSWVRTAPLGVAIAAQTESRGIKDADMDVPVRLAKQEEWQERGDKGVGTSDFGSQASVVVAGIQILGAIKSWQETYCKAFSSQGVEVAREVWEEAGEEEEEGIEEEDEEEKEEEQSILSPPEDISDAGGRLAASAESSERGFSAASSSLDPQTPLLPGPAAGATVSYPCYPKGTLHLLRLPLRHSFHLILHRAFAFLVREAVKNPALLSSTSAEGDLGQLLAHIKKEPLLGLGLFEMPVSVLVLSAEIRAGLWRRNGQLMMDQVINYREPPFCRVFRDMDLLLVQMAALAWGDWEKVMNALLRRFHVWTWLPPAGWEDVGKAAEARGQGGDRKATDSSSWMRPEGGQRPRSGRPWHRRDRWDDDVVRETLLPLGEECLLLLILLITEVPLPPMPPQDRHRLSLRREIVHRLASGPCTHSEVHECCHHSSDGSEVIPESMIEEILASVAVRREARDLEAERFVLSENAWEEYDPAFFHMTNQAHQQALEMRPSPKKESGPSPKACVRPPPPAHPVFAPLRLGLLSSRTLLQVIRTVLMKAFPPSGRSSSGAPASTSFLSEPTEPTDSTGFIAPLPSPPPPSSSSSACIRDSLLPRCLHLLTLAVHALGDCPSSPATRSFFAAMHDTSALPSSSSPSLFSLLLALPSSIASSSDVHLLQGTQWLLQNLGRLDPVCQAALDRSVAVGEGAEKIALSTHARKKTAREKMLAKMQRSAAEFLKGQEGKEEEEEDVPRRVREKKGGDNGMVDEDGGRAGESAEGRILPSPRKKSLGELGTEETNGEEGMEREEKAGGEELLPRKPVCMACRGSSAKEDSSPLGYAAFVQRSNVLSRSLPLGQLDACPASSSPQKLGRRRRREADRKCGLEEEEEGREEEGTIEGGRNVARSGKEGGSQERRQGLVVQLCGHALHYGCFDAYFASVVESSEAMGNLIYNVQAGEYPCPYCKAVSTCLVPHIPVVEDAGLFGGVVMGAGADVIDRQGARKGKDGKRETVVWRFEDHLQALVEADDEDMDEQMRGKTTEEEEKECLEAWDVHEQEGWEEKDSTVLRTSQGAERAHVPESVSSFEGAQAAMAIEEKEKGEEESEEEQEAARNEAALTESCRLFLKSIDSGGSPSSPSSRSRGERGWESDLPVDRYLKVCESLAYTLAVAQVEMGHGGEEKGRKGWHADGGRGDIGGTSGTCSGGDHADVARMTRLNALIRVLGYMTRPLWPSFLDPLPSPVTDSQAAGFSGSTTEHQGVQEGGDKGDAVGMLTSMGRGFGEDAPLLSAQHLRKRRRGGPEAQERGLGGVGGRKRRQGRAEGVAPRVRMAGPLARLLLGGGCPLNVGRGSSSLLRTEQPLLSQNVWCVWVAAAVDLTFLAPSVSSAQGGRAQTGKESSRGKTEEDVLRDLTCAIFVARVVQVLWDTGGVFRLAPGGGGKGKEEAMEIPGGPRLGANGDREDLEEGASREETLLLEGVSAAMGEAKEGPSPVERAEMLAMSAWGMRLGRSMASRAVATLSVEEAQERVSPGQLASRFEMAKQAGKALLECAALFVRVKTAQGGDGGAKRGKTAGTDGQSESDSGSGRGRVASSWPGWQLTGPGASFTDLRRAMGVPEFAELSREEGQMWTCLAITWLSEWSQRFLARPPSSPPSYLVRPAGPSSWDRDRRSLDYPVWAPPRFVPLRASYTELHSELIARLLSAFDQNEVGDSAFPMASGGVAGTGAITPVAAAGGGGGGGPRVENPVLCLVCNAALEAGRGRCTAHARACGRGVGVFFLLQDCSVLLIYLDRACYFPSPYVDVYGERHKQFRGRPLHLDERRLEALRRVWAKQRVPYEVVQARSTSKHVILTNYY